MAMTVAKIVLFFESQSNGWQEVYYASASTLDEAFSTAQSLMGLRQALMATPTHIIGCRVNDADNPRVSRLVPEDRQPTVAYQSESDKPFMAGMMRIYNTSDNRSRALYLRGNPDNAFDLLDPVNADAQLWLQAYAALGNLLSGGSLSFKIKDKPRPIFNTIGGGVVNVVAINSFAPVGTGLPQVLVTTAAVHTLVVGDFVTLYKMKGVPRAGGLYQVVEVGSSTTFVIKFHFGQGYQYAGGGSMLKYGGAYVSINTYAANPRFTERKTGRPFEVTRGRRPSLAK